MALALLAQLPCYHSKIWVANADLTMQSLNSIVYSKGGQGRVGRV